jgi:hypothetical protein
MIDFSAQSSGLYGPQWFSRRKPRIPGLPQHIEEFKYYTHTVYSHEAVFHPLGWYGFWADGFILSKILGDWSLLPSNSSNAQPHKIEIGIGLLEEYRVYTLNS